MALAARLYIQSQLAPITAISQCILKAKRNENMRVLERASEFCVLAILSLKRVTPNSTRNERKTAKCQNKKELMDEFPKKHVFLDSRFY